MEVGCYRQFALSNFSCVTYRVPDSAGDTFSLQLQHGPKPSRCAVFRVDVCRTRRFSTIPLIYYPLSPLGRGWRRHSQFALSPSLSLTFPLSFSLSRCQYIFSRIFHFPFSLVSNFSLFPLLRDILCRNSFHLANSLIFSASLFPTSLPLLSQLCPSVPFVHFFPVFITLVLRIYSKLARDRY